MRGRPWTIVLAVLVVVALAVGVVLVANRWPLSAGQPASTAASSVSDPQPTRSSVPPVPTAAVTPSVLPADKTARPRAELAPVGLNDVVRGEDGVRLAITSIESVQGQAVQAGEVGGPALRVTVTVTNGGEGTLDASHIVVNGYYGADRRPAPSLIQPGGVPFFGTLSAGQSTYGIYVLTIPTDQRANVWISVDYRVSAPVVVFRGAVR